MRRHLWHSLKIFRKFAGERKFGLYCHDRDENRIWYYPALVQLFRGIFWGELGNHFCRKAKERDVR